MKVKTLDMSKYEAMVKALEGILEHRRAHPTTKSDELYYELLIKYHQRVLRAKDEGKYTACHAFLTPTEIFYAMDVVPVNQEVLMTTLPIVLQNIPHVLSVAKGFGFPSEMCSGHRTVVALFLEGWWPRTDMYIWANMACDNTAKSGELFSGLYDMPNFFVDLPFRNDELGVEYYAQELEELVRFIEEQTHRPMDWDRLREAVELSRRMEELNWEISELRKAAPSPVSNRRGYFAHNMDWHYSGTPEGVLYLETLRDEIKQNVDNKKGAIPEERLRVYQLSGPPIWNVRLLDWMERERGVCIVADHSMYPMHMGQRWGTHFDPSRPLESLARKGLLHLMPFQGPLAELGWLEGVVKDAIERKVDGVVYFAHVGCRMICGAVKPVRDALRKGADIPTLVLDVDGMDPTFVSEDELRDRLDAFFETLEDRKKEHRAHSDSE